MDDRLDSVEDAPHDSVRIAHTIPLSMGQFALALAGHKYIHYVHLDTPYAEGTKLLLSCEIDGEIAYIPIKVKKCEPAPEGGLTNGHLSGAGHYITKKEAAEGRTIQALDIADS
ncbi:MAG: hypothetical protein ACOYJ2_09280, partial [Rickettsiales bacterium]